MGELGKFEIPKERWSTIEIDIVSGFPETKNYAGQNINAVLVIVDVMTSRSHFYPIHTTCTTDDIVSILKTFYFPLHGLPHNIVSDQGTIFTSKLFTAFCSALGIDHQLAITAHHATNGKCERYIRTLQQYLRTYILDQQSWVDLIPIAEYAINSTPLSSLGGFSPFEVDIGYIPSGVNSFHYPLPTGSSARALRSSFFIWEELERLGTSAVSCLEAAQTRSKVYFNRNKRMVKIDVGDKVYINVNCLQNIPDVKNKALPPSLRSKFIGPYEVTKVHSPTKIEINMPPSSKRQSNIFHISQLRPQKSIPNIEFIAPDGPPQEFKVYADGSVEMEIDEILSHVKRGKGYALEVKFRDGTTEFIRLKDLLRTAPELTEQYLKQVGLESVFREQSH